MMQIPDTTPIMSAEERWNTTLVTRGGVTMFVRGVLPTDGPILRHLFEHVSPDDLRFRFLAGLRHLDEGRIAQMIDVDHHSRMTFLAFEGDLPVATAMLAAEPDRIRAEVAISVCTDMKGRGIGWSLLQHVLSYAREEGIDRVESMESRDNVLTLALERDAGFGIHPCEGDPADVVASKALSEG